MEADTIKHAEMKEKNKRIVQENEKTSRNQTTEQTSYQRDEYLGCLPCMILGIILEVNEGRTLSNEPENQKTHDYA